MVYKKEKVHIQCGYEDYCKKKNCLKCPRKLSLISTKLTLAEAMAIEDFAVVDLDAWVKKTVWLKDLAFIQKNKYGISQRDLEQQVMFKLMKRIIWEKRGRRWRKLKALFQF